MPRWMLSAVPVCAALLFVAGCNKPADDFREFGAADDVSNTTPEPEHPAHGPHGGHLIELGAEEYHGEVVMDTATRKITVYLLGADAATAALIGEPSVTLNVTVGDAPTSLTLAAAPQEGETDGKSSRFEIAGESVPEAIKDEEDLHGDLVLTIEGTQYRGEISHDHGGHDHGGETHP